MVTSQRSFVVLRDGAYVWICLRRADRLGEAQ